MPFDLESADLSPRTSERVSDLTRIVEVATGRIVYSHIPSFRRTSDEEAFRDKIRNKIYRVETIKPDTRAHIDDDLFNGK
jgi:hypothetical protein